MDTIVNILFWICKILTFYTAALSVFFLLPRRKYPQTAPKTRFALLIPARNEESVIANIVYSLFLHRQILSFLLRIDFALQSAINRQGRFIYLIIEVVTKCARQTVAKAGDGCCNNTCACGSWF